MSVNPTPSYVEVSEYSFRLTPPNSYLSIQVSITQESRAGTPFDPTEEATLNQEFPALMAVLENAGYTVTSGRKLVKNYHDITP